MPLQTVPSVLQFDNWNINKYEIQNIWCNEDNYEVIQQTSLLSMVPD